MTEEQMQRLWDNVWRCSPLMPDTLRHVAWCCLRLGSREDIRVLMYHQSSWFEADDMAKEVADE